MENQKSYYAIIPANVRYCKDLKPNAKLLYGEITALTNDKGYCWALNKYFAELYGVSKETVSRWISQLERFGFVSIEIERNGFEIIKRKIYIDKKIINPMTKRSTPNDQKIKYNTTINNTTNINKNVAKATYPDHVKLAYALFSDFLFKRHERLYPKLKFESISHIDKIFRLDNYTEQEYKTVIDYLMNEPDVSFTWYTNIQSTKKLREKFYQILQQTKKSNNKGGKVWPKGEMNFTI